MVEPFRGVHLLGTLRDSKRVLCKWSASVHGSSVRETWREGSFTQNSACYLRHVKGGFGNGESLSLRGCVRGTWMEASILRTHRDM